MGLGRTTRGGNCTLTEIIFGMMIVIHNHHVHRAHDQHSGGVVEAGDHNRLIGREQSRHKGRDSKIVHTVNSKTISIFLKGSLG